MGKMDPGSLIMAEQGCETRAGSVELARRLAGFMAIVAQRRAAAVRPDAVDLAPLLPILRELLAEVAAARDGQRDLAPLLRALEDELAQLHACLDAACLRSRGELAVLARHERAGRAYAYGAGAPVRC